MTCPTLRWISICIWPSTGSLCWNTHFTHQILLHVMFFVSQGDAINGTSFELVDAVIQKATEKMNMLKQKMIFKTASISARKLYGTM